MKNFSQHEKRFTKNRIVFGLFILSFGALLLASKLTAAIPGWIFTWPVFLIALGLYSGIKHDFRNRGWFLLMLTGGLFLADKILHLATFHSLIVPVLIIAFGLTLITSPSRSMRYKHWRSCHAHGMGYFNKHEEL